MERRDDGMTDRTHYVGCWREHHDCAVWAIDQFREAILDYIDLFNLEHDPCCPADDTCKCQHIRKLENILRATSTAAETSPAAQDGGTTSLSADTSSG